MPRPPAITTSIPRPLPRGPGAPGAPLVTVAFLTPLCRPVASGVAFWRVAVPMASFPRPIKVTGLIRPLFNSTLRPARVILIRTHLGGSSVVSWAKRRGKCSRGCGCVYNQMARDMQAAASLRVWMLLRVPLGGRVTPRYGSAGFGWRCGGKEKIWRLLHAREVSCLYVGRGIDRHCQWSKSSSQSTVDYEMKCERLMD